MIHFFLTGGDLTWQHRSALDTAQVHGAPVVLWYTGDRPAGSYDMRPIRVPKWLEGASPQTMYDVLALKTLSEHGGMTLGLDTISVKPALDLLPPGKELMVCADVPLVDGVYRSESGEVVEHPFNNHLIAKPESPVVGLMLEEARRRVVDGDDRWGATGPLLLTDLVNAYPDRVAVAPFPALSGWEGSFVWRFYQGEQPGPDVRVIHLYSSAYPEEYAMFDWRPWRTPVPSSPSKRLHLLALPHTQVTADYQSCAYTQKIRKFCKMMGDRGWDITLYAGEHCDVDVDEHVILVTEAERARWFGDGFDTVLTPLSWNAGEPYWLTMNSRAIPAIAERAHEKDLILLSTGTQKLVLDAFPFPSRIVAEPFVGYEGIVTGFCAFESQTFMHTVYAKQGIGDGRDFDAVIPNYFDPTDFPVLNTGGDYLLFVGRVIPRKGVSVAAQIAEQTGMRLVIAGPGVTDYKHGHHLRGPGLEILGDHFEYVGEVSIEERAELMAGAHALLAPTSFLEPFGGVAVEAMMTGCPAITTDHGAFMETVPPEFRFRNLQQALDAVEGAHDTDRKWMREQTRDRFSLDAVAPMFEQWFDRLLSLWGDGWYQIADSHERMTACR